MAKGSGATWGVRSVKAESTDLGDGWWAVWDSWQRSRQEAVMLWGPGYRVRVLYPGQDMGPPRVVQTRCLPGLSLGAAQLRQLIGNCAAATLVPPADCLPSPTAQWQWSHSQQLPPLSRLAGFSSRQVCLRPPGELVPRGAQQGRTSTASEPLSQHHPLGGGRRGELAVVKAKPQQARTG